MESGTTLGAYRIERELGAGGMGKVFAATVTDRARGLSIGDRVALKVVHPHLLETPGFFMRFMQEAQIGASIRHANVVRTYMADALLPHHFLVMEYVEGQDLRALLKELGTVPEELCRHIGREIAKGLGAIHAEGVVHRDLKPENVIISLSAAKPDDHGAERPDGGAVAREGNARITEDHVVKIMDLGVALLADEQLRLSQSGAFVGSAEYAAPEQFGGQIDHRCDLHALGLLLYELACGQHPYRADDFRGVMKLICEVPPRRAGDINPQLSPFFEEVIHTLLAKRREDRFPDAATLLGVLEEGEDSAWWHERARALQATTRRPLRRIRIPRETAVYGRERELARLRGLFERARAGNGQVVLIEGEAGIGKSRLVDELIACLQADGEDLNFLFGSYPPGGAATAAGGFSSAFREHFGESGCADYVTQTPLLVPAFDAILRGESSPTGAVALTRDSLGTCFVHATRNLAAERSTVVLIDDLHFAPEEARTLFTALAQAVPGHRVLLVGTMRPGVSEDWVANVTRLDHATRVDVPRLGPKDLGLLLADCFKSSELAHALGMQIAMKSDGNPFFAFEIIRGLREGQFISQRDDGTWASTCNIDDIEIPSSVLDLVNARVADLTDDERDLLDVACCWGFEFDPLVVGTALGLGRIPALKRLGQIERRHRLVRSQGRTYAFDHHQVQEALYGALNEYLREDYHAALAEALETRTKAAEKDPNALDGALCVDLCDHYLRGGRGESALRYLDAAQTHLSKGYMHAQTIALSERALVVPELLGGAARAVVLVRLASALDLLGRRERQTECLREAERLSEDADDDALRGDVATELGKLFYRTSRHDEAEAAYRRALELARARGDREGEVRATGNLGNAFLARGLLAEAQEHYDRARALYGEMGHRAGEAANTVNLGNVLYSSGRYGDAQEQFERGLAISREIGHRQYEAAATAGLGMVSSVLGRRREAREHLERTIVVMRELGDRVGEAGNTVNLGVVLFADDLLGEACRHLERGRALCREVGHRWFEANATERLGCALRSLGRLVEAREHHERHLALGREIGRREDEARAHHNLAVLHREEGDVTRSEACHAKCLAVCEELGLRQLRLETLLALGSLRAATSDGAEGREQLVAARDLAKEIGDPGAEVLARDELALLPGGDVRDALAAFAELRQRIEPAEVRAARLLLWKATGDRAHLADAKRLLDELLAAVPDAVRESTCRNVRLNREILAAWRRECDDGEGPRGTESVTQAG